MPNTWRPERPNIWRLRCPTLGDLDTQHLAAWRPNTVLATRGELGPTVSSHRISARSFIPLDFCPLVSTHRILARQVVSPLEKEDEEEEEEEEETKSIQKSRDMNLRTLQDSVEDHVVDSSHEPRTSSFSLQNASSHSASEALPSERTEFDSWKERVDRLLKMVHDVISSRTATFPLALRTKNKSPRRGDEARRPVSRDFTVR
ncbi:hypothetical protein Dimus_035140 [Dionaea muscipula]